MRDFRVFNSYVTDRRTNRLSNEPMNGQSRLWSCVSTTKKCNNECFWYCCFDGVCLCGGGLYTLPTCPRQFLTPCNLFLVACNCTRLYNPLCPSVGQSVHHTLLFWHLRAVFAYFSYPTAWLIYFITAPAHPHAACDLGSRVPGLDVIILDQSSIPVSKRNNSFLN